MQGQDFPILRGHLRIKEKATGARTVIIILKKLLFNSSKFDNEKNPFYKIFVYPGTIVTKGADQGHDFDETFSVLSNGQPDFGTFKVVIPT